MSQYVTLRAFDQQLKLVLKHYHRPERLASDSPLASPYFLGNRLPDNALSPDAGGSALQRAVLAAGRSLWGGDGPRNRNEIEAATNEILQHPGSPRYAYFVLELRYFQQYFRPRRTAAIWEEFLGESRAQFYRDLDDAVQQLGRRLLQQVQPTFRPETPLTPADFTGRTESLATGLRHLQAGETVSISGAGGAGKTSLGGQITQQWPGGAFWYTIRPGLNDDLHSLLYALGFFLQQQGAAGLWQMLLSTGGKDPDAGLALGLVRHDLAALNSNGRRSSGPLLCLDEVDRLRPPEPEPARPGYRRLLEFIDSLRGQIPLLLVGQRPVLDSDRHLVLDGLAPAQVAELVHYAGIPAGRSALHRLHTFTGGNPRLVRLCLALHKAGESLADLITLLPQTPGLPAMLGRLWDRLSGAEQTLVQALVVYRSPVPPAGLPPANGALDSLVTRRMVLRDGGGGLTMWPALRETVYQELSPEARETYHMRGAAARAMMGEYTAAAYHLWQAGNPKKAVQLWFPHREQEIHRGQAGAALQVFNQISLKRVPRREREALALLRGELKQLSGDLDGGLADMQAVRWPQVAEVTLQARELTGRFQNARGYPDAALETYAEGLAVAARINNQLVKFRNRRSRTFVRQGDLDAAWREARLAQFEATNLQGVIQGKQGHYARAQEYHQQALAIAESLGYAAGIAQAHYDLAAVLGYQGQLDEVVAHTNEAIRFYKRTGDRFNVEMTRINLAGTLIQAGRYAEAAETAAAALDFFKDVPDPYGRAVAAVNLAEAYSEMGEWEPAKEYAYYVLQQEEPYTLPYALYTLGSVQQAQGQLAEAARSYASSIDIGEQNEDRFILAYARRALGQVKLVQGEEETGRDLLAVARDLFTALGLEWDAD